MVPAQPPLPTARNFPFQFSDGSHNSISMRESGEGVRVAATRQKAGSCLKAALCWAEPGAENAPAATSCAVVIFAWGSASAASRSQPAGDGSGPRVPCAAPIVIVAVTIDSVTPARNPAATRYNQNVPAHVLVKVGLLKLVAKHYINDMVKC